MQQKRKTESKEAPSLTSLPFDLTPFHSLENRKKNSACLSIKDLSRRISPVNSDWQLLSCFAHRFLGKASEGLCDSFRNVFLFLFFKPKSLVCSRMESPASFWKTKEPLSFLKRTTDEKRPSWDEAACHRQPQKKERSKRTELRRSNEDLGRSPVSVLLVWQAVLLLPHFLCLYSSLLAFKFVQITWGGTPTDRWHGCGSTTAHPI